MLVVVFFNIETTLDKLAMLLLRKFRCFSLGFCFFFSYFSVCVFFSVLSFLFFFLVVVSLFLFESALSQCPTLYYLSYSRTGEKLCPLRFFLSFFFFFFFFFFSFALFSLLFVFFFSSPLFLPFSLFFPFSLFSPFLFPFPLFNSSHFALHFLSKRKNPDQI